ncbi:MAG: fused MFS/spermidine synthase [Nitrospira defluvii]|nr:fused MFS/spermidine synthase [Nitrospira defluvii]
MLLLFAVSLFLSAFLLFLVQPMIAKMVLPLLGGTPAVWNTCMLFFQVMLLAGYGYVHALTSRFSICRQVSVHLMLLCAPLLLLPIGVASHWVVLNPDHPIPWLLGLLTLSVGLPFFVLSTTAPLLQKWFSSLEHASARDPYFLYVASNVGSMLALLGYPVMIEPYFPLKSAQWFSQSWMWSLGYACLLMLVSVCGWMVRRPSPHAAVKVRQDAAVGQTAIVASPPSSSTYLRWVALAFIPSSLMLGATAYITLNIAAIPLLWVIPLALYLLSFILVFAKWPSVVHRAMVVIMPLAILLIVLSLMPSGVTVRFWIIILLHLATLFVVALVCHGELARSRPPITHLTIFYLLMSVGGALGGIFNALIAPVVFNGLVEYQLVLVLAVLILPRSNERAAAQVGRRKWADFWTSGGLRQDVAWAFSLGLVTLGLAWLSTSTGQGSSVLASLSPPLFQGIESVSRLVDVPSKQLVALVACALPLLLCYGCVARPLRFGLGLGAILLAASYAAALHDDVVLHQERTFFGVVKVERNEEKTLHKLLHGTTSHGTQSLDPSRRDEPLTYYHRSGPIGQAFATWQGSYAKTQIAVIGLGTGTLASYIQPGQSLTFYEIDPAVVRIAQSPRYFTYYEAGQQRGGDLRVVLGDARLKLGEAPDHRYDLIVVDAFSSDAIPVHLITREAMAMYLSKLTDGGVVALHISNRYLELEPVLGNLAKDLSLVGLKQFDKESDELPDKYSSDWVLLARRKEALGSLAGDTRWTPLRQDLRVGVWTDDFSNVLRVYDWTSRH